MSNLESKMFEIFLSDQLFCSLYSALNFMEEKISSSITHKHMDGFSANNARNR